MCAVIFFDLALNSNPSTRSSLTLHQSLLHISLFINLPITTCPAPSQLGSNLNRRCTCFTHVSNTKAVCKVFSFIWLLDRVKRAAQAAMPLHVTVTEREREEEQDSKSLPRRQTLAPASVALKEEE